MSILLCVSITWVTFGLLFVGLDLIFLLIIEHASNTSQAMMAHGRISDQAPQLVKRDLAVDEPGKQEGVSRNERQRDARGDQENESK